MRQVSLYSVQMYGEFVYKYCRQSPKLKTKRNKTQYWKPGVNIGVRLFCRYQYFCKTILFHVFFYVLLLLSYFFKQGSTQMHRPHKGNSWVSLNDTFSILQRAQTSLKLNFKGLEWKNTITSKTKYSKTSKKCTLIVKAVSFFKQIKTFSPRFSPLMTPPQKKTYVFDF